MRGARVGMTLVELIVTLAILGLMGSITVMSIRRADAPAPQHDVDRIVAARREAITRGRSVHLLLRDSLTVRAALALPDGRVVQAQSITHDNVASEVSSAAH